jgi:hypothetical protein
VQPTQSLEDLQADFWPEDESVEDFLAFLEAERKGSTPA